jgi:hypothetical protein
MVINEYGAVVEWLLVGEKRSTSEKNVFQCHSLHYKFHMKSPRIEPLLQEARVFVWDMAWPFRRRTATVVTLFYL